MLRTRLISPYQHDGVKWLVARETASDRPGGFLCDEMGLGKTVQLLATMTVNLKPKTLVVVPKSIVSQWRDEIARFVPSFKVHVFDGKDRELPNWTPGNWVVIAPYSVLPQRPGKAVSPLVTVRWDRVILDEGHEIRNRKSKTNVACRMLTAAIKWVVSGTPIFNSIRDFVALGEFFGMDKQYVQAYPDEIRAKYVLRRTKADVAKHNTRLELPPCKFENMELEMYPEEKQLYREVFGGGQDVVRHVIAAGGGMNMYQMHLLEALLRIRQVCVWPQMYYDGMATKEEREAETWEGRSRKMETLIGEIQKHPTEKALVFCQFMGEMARIEALLALAGVPTWRIDGSVDKDQRESRIAGFKKHQGGGVFLIQIKAGGFGLNLQEATRVYITTPAWNPATELQAIARSHRTGQTQQVHVKKLYYKGEDNMPSVEESIMELQGAKSKVCAQVLNDPRLESQIPGLIARGITVQAVRRIFAV